MKIGIVSDIHSNLAAFQAVLRTLEDENCLKIVCAGDIVGYGPSPAQCLEIIREKRIPCVRGNHDHMMCSDSRLARLRPHVREAVLWSREQLTAEDRQWLAGLPRVLQYAGFELVHSSHVLRPEWHYVIDRRSAAANFLFQTSSICFNGHSHVPLLALHRDGSRPRLVELGNIKLPRGYRFLINVGSVGQPRDRNPMAACATFETREKEVRLLRVRYDVEDTQKKIRKAGLPEHLAARLEAGR